MIALVLLALLAVALVWLGSRIDPRGLGRDEAFRRGAEMQMFPFGRQPTEPVDAERARAGRPF